MKIVYPLLISTIAGLSTILGSFLVFLHIKKNNIQSFIAFCLSFSLGVMISVSITDLIPNSYFTIIKRFNFLIGTIIAIICFLIGYYLTNKLNKSIEKNKKKKDSSNLYRIGILSMLALMLHNFPEGIATFMSAYEDLNLGITLGIAIMMHNIPEGIAIAIPIYYATNSKAKAIKHTLISGLSEPLGAIIAYLFLSKYISMITISYVLLFVAGIMITLSINELLKEALSYKKDKMVLLGILVGAILIIINHFIS